MKSKGKQTSPELGKPGMEEFLTRSRANEGVKIQLHTASGELTAHWLLIRGIDSDAFRKEQTRQARQIADIVQLPETEREAAYSTGKFEMLASLVAGWSFEKECTPEAIKEFLREAPQIADEVDRIASRRTFFFKKRLGS